MYVLNGIGIHFHGLENEQGKNQVGNVQQRKKLHETPKWAASTLAEMVLQKKNQQKNQYKHEPNIYLQELTLMRMLWGKGNAQIVIGTKIAFPASFVNTKTNVKTGEMENYSTWARRIAWIILKSRYKPAHGTIYHCRRWTTLQNDKRVNIPNSSTINHET